MKREIVEAVRDLNRAFGHNAEIVFVDLANHQIDSAYAPSFRRSGYPVEQVLRDAEGNYGFVNPDYPSILFFTIDYFNADLLTSCGCPDEELPFPAGAIFALPLFCCNHCSDVGLVTPKDVAEHEWAHSLQLRLNPSVSKYRAEQGALWFEQHVNL